MHQKYGYEYQLFACLNFLGAVILNFYDNNSSNHITSQKFKMVACGKFNWKTANIDIKIFGTLKLSFHFLEK